jgi:hypothetical protein
VANPEHTESEIPNRALYGSTYKLSAALDTLAADLAPARHAAVVFSESSRASWVQVQQANGAFNVSAAWRRVLAPTIGAWGELLRLGVAAGICNDDQLLTPDGGYSALVARWPVLIAPEKDALTDGINAALASYVTATGTLIRVPGAGWNTEASRQITGQQLAKAMNESDAGLGPVVSTSTVDQLLHTVLLTSATQPQTVVVALVTNFSSCTPVRGQAPGRPAPPIPGVIIELATPPSMPGATLTHAVDIISYVTFAVTHVSGAAGGRIWRVDVGVVTAHAFVVATFSDTGERALDVETRSAD